VKDKYLRQNVGVIIVRNVMYGILVCVVMD